MDEHDSQCQRRNCSPLNVLVSSVQITLISHGVPPLGVSNKGGVGKISSFLCLSVNISKTVADDRLKLLLSVIRKPYSSNPTIPLSTHSVTHNRDSKHLPMAGQVYIVDAAISCYDLLLYVTHS